MSAARLPGGDQGEVLVGAGEGVWCGGGGHYTLQQWCQAALYTPPLGGLHQDNIADTKMWLTPSILNFGVPSLGNDPKC